VPDLAADLRRLFAAVATGAACIAVLLLPAGAVAEDEPQILGDWTVRPFVWQTPPAEGCLYRQWVTIERRNPDGSYAGESRQNLVCRGEMVDQSTAKLRITVENRTVTIDSPKPSWITEVLTYVSPMRMEGKDGVGHKMIYERETAPGTS